MALWFPYLPTDRLQRREKCRVVSEKPSPSPPLAVAAKQGSALTLYAVDRKAATLGLVCGMALADARTMVPGLTVVAADEAADLQLLETIADWCDRFTPFVALVSPHALLLDVTGAAHLFGGERVLLDLVRASLKKQGFIVQGALAGTAAAARALAQERDGVIAAPGEEAVVVAPLPIATLALAPAVTHALRRAGLKTIGQVAGRLRAELVARFGSEVVTTIDRTLGKAEQPISPRVPLPDYMAEHRFAEPLTSEAAITGTLRGLAESIMRLLEKRGEGARVLQASFFRADGAVRRLVIETAKPTRDPAIVERLFREKLDALADPLDPGFGFDLIRLSANRAEHAPPETIGFDVDRKDDEEIAFLIDRMAARFGAQRIVSFQPNDTHIPEAAAVAAPAQYARASKLSWETIREAREAPRRPLRLFAKPEPIEVVAEVPEGPPVRFRWRHALHAVALAEGPERIAMEWWRHQAAAPTRDYFRVEDTEGRRFWLYRAGLYGRETDSPRWFVHGVFA
ncbi:MAG: DNA polymerase Y family protein [Rhizomicrobium sp.]